MANTIQVKRGVEGSLPALGVGELGFCTDSHKLFVGSAGGNKELLRKSVFDTHEASSSIHHIRYADSEAVDAVEAENEITLGNITLAGVSRRITFAPGDYCQFNTAYNYWELKVASAQRLRFDAGNLQLLTTYGLTLSGTNRYVNFDSGWDTLKYNTSLNKYQFLVGNVSKAEIGPTGLTLPNVAGNACYLDGLAKGIRHETCVNPSQNAPATWTWYDVTGASISWTSYATEDLLILSSHSINRNGAGAYEAIYMGSKLDAAGEQTLMRINMIDDWPTEAGIWMETNVAAGAHTWKLRFKVTATLIRVQTQRIWIIRFKH